MNAITIAFIIGVISIICIGIWLMKGTIDFIAERNEYYRKNKHTPLTIKRERNNVGYEFINFRKTFGHG